MSEKKADSMDVLVCLPDYSLTIQKVKVKVKQSRYRAWSGPEGSRKLRFPDFMTTVHEGGKG